ncbi:hypothetical protein L6E12_21040 [Actinokineospora sp. PR83]|uniref:hypothetical protein n=1 Tax=Actinokineospora sp. PR83 TaxID=2884908 RepID=UPI001F18F2BF|nr:hypothetical protein [Actinokineospora sp. PR83]MCG8918272.1 hypothetical protein [Actinokineospora sp. PR83]
MTEIPDRPAINGHRLPGTVLAGEDVVSDVVDAVAGEERVSPSPADTTAAPVSAAVAALQRRVIDKKAQRALLHEYAELVDDEVFTEIPSEAEERKDREVAETIRTKARRERKRAGKAEIRRRSRVRRQDRWDARADRARHRILDPARALGADYRKLVASSGVVFALLAGGVAWMSRTVHHGLVGVDGPIVGYLVEPLASVLLVVSLVAQFTARARGIAVPRGFYWFDGALAAASVLLNVLPWGLRFGWNAGDLLVHLLVPALVVGAVVAWHLVSGLYGEAIAASKDAPVVIFKDDAVTAEHLALLREATAEGALSANPSVTAVIKTLRKRLPGGIGQQAARRVAAIYLGH